MNMGSWRLCIGGSGGGSVGCRGGVKCVLLGHIIHVPWIKWLGVLFLTSWWDMGIWDNGGGGGGSGSGVEIGARKNSVVWCGFIVEGDCLVVSTVASIIVHIVGFLF